MTRKPAIHFDNDATSCYDQINVCIANIVSRKFGQSKKVCIVEGRTLAEARYHLKTKLGVSDEFVQHCQFHPWFGSGQGAGDAPTKWLVMGSTLFDEYECRATGALYESPDGSWSLQLFLVGFVDDTRNTINQFGNHNAMMEELCMNAQNDCQLWHDLLGVVNQQLELPKCGYHALAYEFLPTGKPKLINHPNAEITLVDMAEQPLRINQWPNDKAAKYLGHQASLSNKQSQLQALTNKCDTHSRVIHCCHLNWFEVHTFYQAIYHPSIGFCLPCSHFTVQELSKAQLKAHRAFITKSGYNRNTASCLIYGPHFLGGAGFSTSMMNRATAK